MSITEITEHTYFSLRLKQTPVGFKFVSDSNIAPLVLILRTIRFCETYSTTYQRFVADQSAFSILGRIDSEDDLKNTENGPHSKLQHMKTEEKKRSRYNPYEILDNSLFDLRSR